MWLLWSEAIEACCMACCISTTPETCSFSELSADEVTLCAQMDHITVDHHQAHLPAMTS